MKYKLHTFFFQVDYVTEQFQVVFSLSQILSFSFCCTFVKEHFDSSCIENSDLFIDGVLLRTETYLNLLFNELFQIVSDLLKI